jgi:hypothetical protein
MGSKTFLSCNGRAGALQALDQLRYGSGGVHSAQEVYMGLDHAELEDICPFLAGHCSEKPTQEPGEIEVDKPLACPRGPDQVDVKTVPHVR